MKIKSAESSVARAKLMILKIHRPDLFTISGEEQIARLIAVLLKGIFT